jgi:WD40 repeat protein
LKGETLMTDVKLPNHIPTAVFLNPLETILYIGTSAGPIFEVALYPTQAGQTELLFEELKGHDAEVSSMDMSIDGSILCSTSLDGTVRVWDCHTRQTTSTYDSGKPGLNWCHVTNLPEIVSAKENASFSFSEVPMSGALERDFSETPESEERKLCEGDNEEDERKVYWKQLMYHANAANNDWQT